MSTIERQVPAKDLQVDDSTLLGTVVNVIEVNKDEVVIEFSRGEPGEFEDEQYIFEPSDLVTVYKL